MESVDLKAGIDTGGVVDSRPFVLRREIFPAAAAVAASAACTAVSLKASLRRSAKACKSSACRGISSNHF